MAYRLSHMANRKEEKLNAKTRRLLMRALKDIKEGKNMSPAFDNVEDAIAYLKKK